MRWVQYRDALSPSRFLSAHDRGQTVHQVRHWLHVAADDIATEEATADAAQRLGELRAPRGADARRAWDGLHAFIQDGAGRLAESACATAFNRLRQWPGIATRSDKLARNYRAGIVRASIALLWLR